jgi:hypothetical protein
MVPVQNGAGKTEVKQGVFALDFYGGADGRILGYKPKSIFNTPAGR